MRLILDGESFTKKVGEGLTKSRYVIPVISQVFVGKPWPEYELDAALGMEAAGQEAKVLPLIVSGQGDLIAQVKQKYPFLQNRKFLFGTVIHSPWLKLCKSD